MRRIVIVSLAMGAAVALCAATLGSVTASTGSTDIAVKQQTSFQVAQKKGCAKGTRWSQNEKRCVPTG